MKAFHWLALLSVLIVAPAFAHQEKGGDSSGGGGELMVEIVDIGTADIRLKCIISNREFVCQGCSRLSPVDIDAKLTQYSQRCKSVR